MKYNRKIMRKIKTVLVRSSFGKNKNQYHLMELVESEEPLDRGLKFLTSFFYTEIFEEDISE